MPIALVFFIHYAYLLVSSSGCLVEQIGIPIPSIPVLLTAGTLSARLIRVNHFYVVLAVLVCMPGCGHDLVLHWAGAIGNSVLKLLCRLSFEASTCVSKTEGYFHAPRASHFAVREVRTRPKHGRGAYRRPDRNAVFEVPYVGSCRLTHLG